MIHNFIRFTQANYFQFDYSSSASVSTFFFQSVILPRPTTGGSEACARDCAERRIPIKSRCYFDLISASIEGDPSLALFRRTSTAQDDVLKKWSRVKWSRSKFQRNFLVKSLVQIYPKKGEGTWSTITHAN